MVFAFSLFNLFIIIISLEIYPLAFRRAASGYSSVPLTALSEQVNKRISALKTAADAVAAAEKEVGKERR